MDYEHILYEVSEGIATITMNRPDRLNAWTGTMDQNIRHALREATDDSDVKVIILTGAGRGFCAGADLGGLEATAKSDKKPEPGAASKAPPAFDEESRDDFHRTYTYFPSVPKPIIAAVNGPCAGLGMVMALFCDMRIAGEKAAFTTAFAKRGLIAEHGMSWVLPRLTGHSNALDLLMSA
ncbi:MAG: enoyl-CoA hydratase-related protein, partial [Pseudomonadota bacterium]